jgi:hypothetical protein
MFVPSLSWQNDSLLCKNGQKLPFPYLGLREFAGGVGGIVRLLGHQALAVVPAGRRQRSAAGANLEFSGRESKTDIKGYFRPCKLTEWSTVVHIYGRLCHLDRIVEVVGF